MDTNSKRKEQMKLTFKKICIVVLIIALLMPSFASAAFAAKDADVDITIDALKGSVAINGVQSGATVYWQHIVVPADFVLTAEGSEKEFSSGRENAETGWLFYPNYESHGKTRLKDTVLMCFADAYGISLKDDAYTAYDIEDIEKYDKNALSDLQKEGLKIFEQDVMKAFIQDAKANDESSTSTVKSEKLKHALENIRERIALYYAPDGNTTASNKKTKDFDGAKDGNIRIRQNLNSMSVDTGLYVMYPTDNGTYTYSPCIAFVNFTYSSESGNGNADGIENVVINAKKSENKVDKAPIYEHSYTVGDVVDFRITSTYPSIPLTCKATATYTLEDSSTDFNNYTDVVVKIGDTVLKLNQDYTLTITDDNTTARLLITLLDGSGNLPDYDYKNGGNTVTVEYKATVKKLRQWKTDRFFEIWNTAKGTVNLGDGSEQWTDEVTVKAYPISVKVQKLETSTNNKLTGAVFAVKRYLANGEFVYVTFKYEDNLYKVTGTSTTLTNACKVTINNKDGETIVGLDGDDLHVISEIKAPTGYSLSLKNIVVGTQEAFNTAVSEGIASSNDTFVKLVKKDVIKNRATCEYKYNIYNMNNEDKGTNVVTYSYYNTSLMALPSTGGFGTYAFTIIGVAAIATAVIIIRNKKDKELDVEI